MGEDSADDYYDPTLDKVLAVCLFTVAVFVLLFNGLEVISTIFARANCIFVYKKALIITNVIQREKLLFNAKRVIQREIVSKLKFHSD